MSERVLLTGGAGFIGSHLADRLIAEGYHVTCVDDFCSGQRLNVKHQLDSPLFHLVEADLTKGTFFEQKFESFNYIFHLASPASPVFYKKYAEKTLLVNSLTTVKLLEMADEMEARLVYTSTSEVYGDPLEHPQKETYYWGNVNPVGPKAHYKEAKRFGEAAVITYHRERGVDGRIVRIFNTYGPRNRPDDGRVIPNFINQALDNRSLTIYGEGSQTRSYCYISDLVEGLMKVMFTEGLAGEVINLGNPDEYSILETAELIRQKIDPNLEFTHLPLPAEDPHRRRPDISKAQRLLDWGPRVNFSDGLDQTIQYFRQLRDSK